MAEPVGEASSSAIVELGRTVQQGDTLASSGNSGFSSGPHLHFHVERYGTCNPTDGCVSAPVNFRNTRPNPIGLVEGEMYLAGNIR